MSVRNGTKRWSSRATKQQLLNEVERLQRRNDELERSADQHQRVNQAPRESERRLELIMNAVPAGISYFGTDERFCLANQNYQSLLGMPPSDLIGKTLKEAIGEMPYKVAGPYAKRALKGEPVSFENTLPAEDGGEISIAVSYVPHFGSDGTVQGFVALVNDITERKQSEKALRESEARYRSLINLSPDAIVVHCDGAVVLVNRAGAQLFGAERPEEMIGKPAIELVHPDFREIVRGRMRQVRDDKVTIELVEEEFQRLDGSKFIAEVAAAALEYKGRPAIQVVIRDITKRKRAEESLRITQFSLDHASDATFWLDSDGRVVYASTTTCNMLGYSREEVLALSVADIDPDVRPGDFNRALKRIRTSGSSTFEAHFRTKAGAIIPVEVSVHYLKYGDEELMTCYSRDTSERKAAEKRLRQREAEVAHVLRRHILGEMASTLAHELNQPLAAVSTFSDVCLRKFRSGGWQSGELESMLTQIHEQAGHAGQIMRRIRQFVQKSEPAASPAYINDIVNEAIQLMATELRSRNVELTLELEDGLPRVLVDGIEIEQVVLNLVRNSIEAMTEIEVGKRQLTIRTSMAAEDTVEVTVRDAGAGLPAELADKAFDPFFTTKPRGMGMGLPISRTIVEAHGGRISARQDAERGATFGFTLPADGEDPGLGA